MSNKKIAIICSGSLNDRKGLVNACLNRVKFLKNIANYSIDVYFIQSKPSRLFCFLKKIKRENEYPSICNLEGMTIRLLWYSLTVADYILCVRLKLRSLWEEFCLNKYVSLFKSYDLISVHSIPAVDLAYKIYRKYGTPYCVTWHGSDIHSLPFTNKCRRKDIIRYMHSAEMNFFVSRSLLEKSNNLDALSKKQILYNGVGEGFICYPSEQRNYLRREFSVENKKVLAFVGNLLEIKNALLLPEIYKRVKDLYQRDITFWIIGDGKLRTKIESLNKRCNLICKMWGNQPVEKMPDFMNCIDVLVLPSQNEGLPLVTVEALRCGCNVVGSNVGGIPEVIGEENVVDLDSEFVEKISLKIVKILINPKRQILPDIFNWKTTALKENEFYQSILSR